MYIQCSTVKRKGKVSRNRKLVESYRDPVSKQPRVRTVQRIEGLPVADRAKIIYEYGGKKHLTPQEWNVLDEMGLLTRQPVDFEVGDVFRGGGTAVAFHHMKQSGLFHLLDRHLDRVHFDVIKELVIYQLLYAKSKLDFTEHRKSSLLYVLGGKTDYKEDKVYLAMNALAENMEPIKTELAHLAGAPTEGVLLYDLSNSYFTGTQAELGGRGQSKEKRHDRFIVTYGLVMNQANMPLDIRIWKGGTADSKTIVDTFADWKRRYRASQGIWVGDRSMSGQPALEDLADLGLNYITGLPGNAQQAMLQLQLEQQPELFDQQGLTSFVHQDKRYVVCKHQAKGYRKQKMAYQRRRKVYNELKQIQQTPQNTDDKRLYHRAMRVLENYEQTFCWTIEIVAAGSHRGQQRYMLTFALDRQAAQSADKAGHYYLLQTDLPRQAISDEQVQASYKDLMDVERSFRDMKSQIKVRPIRHRTKPRIEAHIYLCFLSLWLSKYIENKWREKNRTTEVGPTLARWDRTLLLCEKIDDHGHLTQIKWNMGNNAQQTMQEITSYGEDRAIKAHL